MCLGRVECMRMEKIRMMVWLGNLKKNYVGNLVVEGKITLKQILIKWSSGTG